MLLSIVTPTYNRAHCLAAAWDSLMNQSIFEFEWIIIDDGSEDNTEVLVQEWIGTSPFLIRYEKQQNGGKHRALNRGVQMSTSEYTAILDSDDSMVPTFVALVKKCSDLYKSELNFGGISGRINDTNGRLIGPKIDAIDYCSTIEYRYNKGILGDQLEVFLTEVLKQFPFPNIENEKFVPEALIWNRIGQKYKLVHLPYVFQIREYLDGGLTDRIVKIRMTSPIASMLTYSELSSYAIPIKQKIKAGINFWRFSFNSSMPFIEKLKLIGWRYLPLLPFGFVYYVYDMYKYI